MSTEAFAAPFEHLRVVLITDAAIDVGLLVTAFGRAARILPPGSFALQLRDKARSVTELEPIARALREATLRVGAPFIVGDHVELAVETGADGAHVPGGACALKAARRIARSDLPLSTPCHEGDDVEALLDAGADTLFVSPIFASPGKGPPRGVEALVDVTRRARTRRASVRVVALGGIAASNADACFDAGASSVAFVRPWLEVPRSETELASIADILRKRLWRR